MAQRRMFSLKIVDTDDFLDMPTSSRLLYYDLAMRADDDGFINSPKKIVKMTGGSDDDLRVLESKQFIIPFESGICVIKDWRIHNYIQKDRYQDTIYKKERSQLTIDENQSYVCTQNVSKMESQVRLESEKELEVESEIDKPLPVSEIVQNIFDYWQSKKIVVHSKLLPKMATSIKSAIKTYGEDFIKDGIDCFAAVLNSSDTFWTHKWGITDFISRKGGLEKFGDFGDPAKAIDANRKKKDSKPGNNHVEVHNRLAQKIKDGKL